MAVEDKRKAGKPGPKRKDSAPTDQRLREIIDLSRSMYWEQDADHRFTLILGPESDELKYDPETCLGKTPWETDSIPLEDEGSWDGHRAVLSAGQSFSDFRYQYQHPRAGPRCFSSSGRAVFSDTGEFLGYRGVDRDITEELNSTRLRELENAITRILVEAESFDGALTGAIRAVCQSEGFEAGRYWKLDEDTRLLRFDLGWSAAVNPDVVAVNEQAREVVFARGEGLPGWVWQNNEPLWVPDLTMDYRVAHVEVSEKTGWRAGYLFPVTFEDKIIGILDFNAGQIPCPDERLADVMGIIGAEIGHFYQRAMALEQLSDSEARFRGLTKLSSDWYWEKDADFRFTRFEGASQEEQEYFRERYVGKRSWEIGVEVVDAKRPDEMKLLMEAHEPFRDVVMSDMLPDGSKIYVSVSGEPVFDKAGNFSGYRGLSRNITASKRAEERIQYLATHDYLTNLPNRLMFNELLTLAIETAQRYMRKFAVMYIDLDHFKFINDTLGHHAGDSMLKEIASRLKQCKRTSDVLSRLGGDEFVVLIQEVHDESQVETVAQHVLSAISEPFKIMGREFRITASIGICIYPDDTRDEEVLMRNADMTMYRVKEQGKNNFQFYSQNINQ